MVFYVNFAGKALNMKRSSGCFLLLLCLVGVVSCSALRNLFGGGDIRIENTTRFSYYKDFLKDTLRHAVYIYTFKDRDTAVNARKKLPDYPEAYIFNAKTQSGFRITGTDSITAYVKALQEGATAGLPAIDFLRDQYFKKFILSNTEVVFAHDNLFLKQEGKQDIDIYLIDACDNNKQQLKKMSALSELDRLATLHIIDLTLNKPPKK